MSPLPILWLVVRSEVRNRLRQQLRRLKQPKYLVPTIVGISYLWFFVWRRLFLGAPGTNRLTPFSSPSLLPTVESVVVLVALVQTLFIWLLPGDRAQVGFNEGEVQFFFPAPVTRRWLLNFKLMKRIIGVVLGAIVTALFMSRGLRALGANAMTFGVGAGLAFITLYLHRVAATFTKDRLREIGPGWMIGFWCLTLGGLTLVSVFLWRGWRNFEVGLKTLTEVHPIDWLTFPMRLISKVMFATDASHFLAALPGALGLVVAHYVWLLLVLVPFEESALQASELRARMSPGSRRREVRPTKVFALKLAATGRPEVAILWKNWLAAIRRVGARSLAVMSAFAIAVFAFLAASKTTRNAGAATAMAGVLALGLLVLLGPSLVRVDLRHDLKRLDVLRSLPLTGFQVVSAEVLASGLLLVALEFIATAVACWFSGSVWPYSVGERLSVAAGIFMVIPGICFLGMIVQNAAALLFPTWVGLGDARARGLEATGQRLLTAAGTLVVLMVGVLPGAIVSGIVVLLCWSNLGLYSSPIAGAVSGTMLLVESYLGLVALGRLFDGYDVTD